MLQANLMADLLVLVGFILASGHPGFAALPQFSWDTLPVFFHSANATGPYSDASLQTIAKFQMATIEKSMGHDIPGVDDEDIMVLTMIALKRLNPNIATYFYMNSYKNFPGMSRITRDLEKHPNYYLIDGEGNRVKNGQGFYVFDLSNPEVRKWWLDFCLNATMYANGDGCFCDSSQRVNASFHPRIPANKKKAWGEGLLNLTREAQEALGDDNLLIGKFPNQSYVKAIQMEFFEPNNDSINALMLGVEVGQVVQAHVPINVSCSSDLTDYIAAFLVGAGQYSYFGCGQWRSTGDTRPVIWRKEYDKPIGSPLSSAQYVSGIWSRSFSLGTNVTLDIKTNKGSINWA